MMESLAKIWQWLGAYPWVPALGLLFLAFFAAKVLDLVLTRFIKSLTAKTANELDDALLKQLHRPLQITVILGTAVIMAKIFISKDHIQGPVTDTLYSVLVITWTWVALRCFGVIFDFIMQRHREDSSLRQSIPLFKNLVMVLLIAHGAYWLMKLWHINVTPLLASAGIVTAAVALASKDTLANFFGGISIFVDRPYNLGDYVILDTGERGEVINIGLRSTKILTRDDVQITVPNAVMANSKIVNQSGMVNRFRVRAAVGVAYDSDLDLVQKELLAATAGIDRIIPMPEPRVRFRSFGDSALEFELLFWVRRPGERGKVLHQVNLNIHCRFKEAGIEIPFPQRVVHMPPVQNGADPVIADSQPGD